MQGPILESHPVPPGLYGSEARTVPALQERQTGNFSPCSPLTFLRIDILTAYVRVYACVLYCACIL
jgi:hypothetical protein